VVDLFVVDECSFLHDMSQHPLRIVSTAGLRGMVDAAHLGREGGKER